MLKVKVISYTLLAVLTADLLAMTGDTSATWTSPMFIKLNSTDPIVNPVGRPIKDPEQALIASILNIGAIIGPFPFSFMAQKFGRKISILAIAIPHLIAYGIAAFSNSVYLYYISRFITGLATGAGYTLLPMYIAEVAEDSNRGSLSATLNIFWCLGNFIPLAVGPFIPALWFNIILCTFPVLFFFLFLIIAPESPYYLVSINNLDKAEESLMLLRSKEREYIKEEVTKLKNGIEGEVQGTLCDLFQEKSVIKALLISVVLIIGQQFSGINAVLMFAQPIFVKAGGNLSSEVCSLIIGLVLFLTSFTTPFVADRYGRKILLIISTAGSWLSHLVFGIYSYLDENTSWDMSVISWVPIASILFYLTCYNFALGPLAWTVTSELFPSNVKSVGASVTAVACWAASFLVTNYFTALNNIIGTFGTFWLFSICSLGTAIFIFFFVPETRGKSFEEVQYKLNGHDSRTSSEK